MKNKQIVGIDVPKNENSFIKECLNRMLDHLNNEIGKTEDEIHRIINENEDLSANFKLLLSIKGIGKVLAMYFITLSGNFVKGYEQSWTVETIPTGSKFTFMEEIKLPYGIIGKIMGLFAQRG